MKVINNRYLLAEKIGEGGMSLMYLAEDLQNPGKKYAVKILKNKSISRRIDDIIRFRNEADIISKLEFPNILKIYEIGEAENQYYIVMEYIDGASLHKLMSDGRKFSPEETLDIVVQLCQSLITIHNSGVVHRDLKPGNIMITESGKAKIIDFGLAQVKEFSEIKDKDEVIGTFSYMSPEQCGIIKRSIDERSDLYSLGIIFYQLLTGQLPFMGDSISSIIHKQIAETPRLPRDLEDKIPETLRNIVLKLMEKEQEARYQSAKGLLADLQKYRSGQRLDTLGQGDALSKLNFRTNLIGRDEEMNLLKRKFDETRSGIGNLVFISGEAGLGKTRLVDEFKNYSYTKGAVFIGGKCFSRENKIPFGVFSDSLTAYSGIFHSYHPEKKEIIRKNLREAVAELGKTIAGINPFILEIIGDAPEPVKLEPEKENKRLLIVLARFMIALCQAEKGLVLFLDDLQWVDEGSIELLKEIMFDIKNHKVMVLGTYRDNEVDSGHKVAKFIQEQKDNYFPISEIKISLFDRPRMLKFVSGLLYSGESKMEGLADFILLKSKGNPFFAIEILKQLVHERVLKYENDTWDYREETLKSAEIAESIVEIVLKRIKLLEENEISVLSHAAVIGKKFDISFLFGLFQNRDQDRVLSETRIVEIIDKAIELQLLEVDTNAKSSIYFIHDRIRDAFSDNLEAKVRKSLHDKILAALESQNRKNPEASVFELAYHSIESGQAEKILQYAFPAGIRAKAENAYEEALRYFSAVRSALENTGQRGSELWANCTESVAEVLIITGNCEEAVRLLTSLLDTELSIQRQSDVLRKIGSAYFRMGDFQNADHFGRRGLGLLHENAPSKGPRFFLSSLKEGLLLGLRELFKIGPKAVADPSRRDRIASIIWYYYDLTWQNQVSDIRSLKRNSMRMVNLAGRHLGKSKELVASYTRFGSFCFTKPDFPKARWYHTRALEISRELGDSWSIAKSLQSIAQSYIYNGDYQQCLPYLEESIELFRKIADIMELGICYHLKFLYYYQYSTDYAQAKAANAESLSLCRRTRDHYGELGTIINLAILNLETGHLEEAKKWGFECHRQSLKREFWLIHCGANIQLGRIFIETGETEEAVRYLEKAKEIFKKRHLFRQYSVDLFYCLADAYLEQFKKRHQLTLESGAEISLPGKDEAFRKELSRIRNACKEALEYTRSWTGHYAGALWVNAKWNAFSGRTGKSLRYFALAVKIYSQLGKKYELARCLFDFGIVLRKSGKTEEAYTRLNSAYRLFREINSKTYLTRTMELLGLKEDTEVSAVERLNENQRYSSIIKVSQDISSILNIDKLLEHIMTKSIEITGAQRGCLFIRNDRTDELELKAVKGVSDEISSDISYSIVRNVYQNSVTVLAANAREDAVLSEYQSVRDFNLKSILCIPIRFHEKPMGVCYLDNPLSTGVFTEDDAELLRVFMNQASIAIENASLYQNLEAKVEERTKELNIEKENLKRRNETMEKDLDLARNIQMQFIPSQSPTPQIAFRYQPMEKVGGDFFDFLRYSGNDWTGIFISDVSGHGVSAAFLTSMIKSLLLQNAFYISSPASILNLLNDLLIEQAAGNFITAFYGIYKPSTREFVYANAGHNHPYLLQNGEKTFLGASGGGFPLAVMKKSELKEIKKEYFDEKTVLEQGSKLVLYTDGFTEAVHINCREEEEGNDFESLKLDASFAAHGAEPAEVFIESVYHDLVDFHGSDEFEDDVCIICLDVV